VQEPLAQQELDPGRRSELSPPEYELNFFSRARGLLGIGILLPLAVFAFLTIPAHHLDWPQFEQGGSQAEELLISAIFALLGVGLLWGISLIVWRLRGPDFDVRVHQEGLLLHPRECNQLIEWSTIRRSRVIKTQGRDRSGYWYNVLELELTTPVRSLWYPIGTTKLKLSSPRRWGHNPHIAELGRRVRAHRRRSGWKR